MPRLVTPRQSPADRLATTLTMTLLTASLAMAQDEVNFNRDIRPLLADRCFHCHGPDQHNRKGKLRLDRAEGRYGAYRVRDGAAAIKPGAVEASAVWQRLTTTDDDERMPPTDSHKRALSAEEVETIRRWIAQGAEYQDHWAFVPLTTPAQSAQSNTQLQPIDQFVQRRLQSAGLRPSPAADRRTLMRRLSFDLTGLPPTRAELQAFVEDRSTAAYQRVVDRLLARRQYGEHMARYWLDLVRFADTNGVHHDHYREMSPYRDWLIRAFNRNLPYDQFVSQQIAGDLYPEATDDQRIASGFNRLHLIIDRGTALPEESFARNVIDRVTAVGTAFLGLTVQCAVCHDHKYDPIKQRDFYRLFAFFNNLDGAPETGGRGSQDFKRGLQPPYINLPNRQQEQALRELTRQLESARHKVDELRTLVGKHQGGEAKTDLQQQLKASQRRLQRWKDAETKILMQVPAAMVMRERAKVQPAHVLIRGAYDKPGALVEPGTPSFLPAMPAGNGRKTRLDLARWLVSPNHPLTARVAINRLWQQLFGVGIVKTSEDFGTQGEWPSHPELLDYLAVSFIESGWNIKALLKQIVMSQTYQQSSAADPKAFSRDPENRLLARGSRFRLDAEMIRDQILATSGLLNATLFGKSVKPPQPAGIWKAVTLPDSFPRVFRVDQGQQIYRRSVYTFWKRGMPPPQMSILNAPTRESCIARRERTNTPLQALLLLNEQEYLKAARHLAASILHRGGSVTQRIDSIFETITAQLPDANERQVLRQSLDALRQLYREDTTLAQQLCKGIELPGGHTAAELAAWTLLVSTIYNLDITKTRD